MTMNNITVGIYSYKGKKVFDVIDSLLNNKNDNTTVTINLKDQHPMDREDQFKSIIKKYNNSSGSYHHVFWDWIVSPISHKEEILRIAKNEYYLFLSDNILLSQNWDTKLIDFISNKNIILSGNKNINLTNKNLFYLNKNESDIDNFTKTQYINRDFIFGRTSIFKKINLPKYIKYDGEEEILSIRYFMNELDIYAIPSNIYNYCCETSIKNLYTPFQTSHKYNEAISLIKNGYNSFESYDINKLKEFWQYHNFNINKIKKIPFENNDVSYDPNSSKYDKIDGRRFIDKQNTIN
jgi:hypothetical protein